MRIGSHLILTVFTILTILFMSPFFIVNATTVREVLIDEMLRQSQFVFEGTVTAVEAKQNDQKRIHTYVTFQIKEIVKGEYQNKFITLRFAGGTVGNATMKISDMRVPRLGEHGIYFVESLERFQVNPLYGWSQGHFIVQTDTTGSERVMTNRRLPIKGLMDGEHMTAAKEGVQAISRGVARDIVLGQEGRDIDGMTVNEFRRVLHERMGRTNE